ncbi:flagellar M-ring protein FliF [Pseudomonas sp. B21-056]|jgi:flagellar M-ring protein FliF|uniref:flagellar basal-body MS-ring/collar protein FliF n=1 Tax=Pseudomonas sp. B21-056 TaxID=2895495 RepID=UPI00222F27C8|nr:flagellar basal-body MS-ring/collar protein FliF [Pseudomonas sp. B21-056]UZE26179.1 flagellar M-ring protein FliF [Pseudomonas sp. B21-056]
MENQPVSSFLAGRTRIFLIGTVLIAGLLAASVWWVLRPQYVALYRNADEASQAQILATLSQRHVPYRINTQQGAIEVLADHAASARMYLAEAGIPTRGGPGFELFDKADYGMSEFSQKINYQRAMEGELARTIMSISEVEYARVHLTFKKTSLYQQAEEPPKASVIVRLRATGTLMPQRVRGIQQLVASAVEGMTLERVSVLNEDGQVLSATDSTAAAPEHLQLTAQVEQALKLKAEELLARPLGQHGVDVSVRVLMNFDRVKSISEQPLTNKIRREKRTESTENSSGESTSKRFQNNREIDYEVGKARAETEHASGKIERITVGVVLSTPVTDAQQKDIQALLEAALGLDLKRGDRLVMVYIPDMPVPQASAVAQASTEPAPVSHVEVPAPVNDDPALPWTRWLGIGLMVLLAVILLFWVTGRRRTVSVPATVPRLTSVEREQLLVDLRRWLLEGR